MEFINIPIKVMDRVIFWNTSENEKGWKLQRHYITGHARILDKKGVRIAWGSYDKMASMMEWIIKPWKGCKKGDILAVKRYNGVYAHYAVYVGYGKVIHYAQEANAKISDPCSIRKADFSEFLKTDTKYEVIHFPEDGSDPIHECIDIYAKDEAHVTYESVELFPNLKAIIRKLKGYHLYSPKETVERAKSRLGEDKYNLAFNNCEHFAVWCKTGLKESSQVDELWKVFWAGKTKIVDTDLKKHRILALS